MRDRPIGAHTSTVDLIARIWYHKGILRHTHFGTSSCFFKLEITASLRSSRGAAFLWNVAVMSHFCEMPQSSSTRFLVTRWNQGKYERLLLRERVCPSVSRTAKIVRLLCLSNKKRNEPRSKLASRANNTRSKETPTFSVLSRVKPSSEWEKYDFVQCSGAKTRPLAQNYTHNLLEEC